jgi:hypothetical protein
LKRVKKVGVDTFWYDASMRVMRHATQVHQSAHQSHLQLYGVIDCWLELAHAAAVPVMMSTEEKHVSAPTPQATEFRWRAAASGESAI